MVFFLRWFFNITTVILDQGFDSLRWIFCFAAQTFEVGVEIEWIDLNHKVLFFTWPKMIKIFFSWLIIITLNCHSISDREWQLFYFSILWKCKVKVHLIRLCFIITKYFCHSVDEPESFILMTSFVFTRNKPCIWWLQQKIRVLLDLNIFDKHNRNTNIRRVSFVCKSGKI